MPDEKKPEGLSADELQKVQGAGFATIPLGKGRKGYIDVIGHTDVVAGDGSKVVFEPNDEK